jgi:hypothetical protein
MGITDKRKIHRAGEFSKSVVLPAGLRTGTYATMAADRLVLIDPRGEIPADALLDLMEKHLEPAIWQFLTTRSQTITP